MASRYVRIYNGPEHSSVIGFSASAAYDAREADFSGFMQDRDYKVHEYDTADPESKDTEVIRGLGGVSVAYYGIEPPLRDRDIPLLAYWCRGHIDPYHNSAYLVDNRNTSLPMTILSQGETLAEW